MAHFMNFTPKIINLSHGETYGFPLPNGTFIVAPGNVIYTYADISVCSHFIKHYNTTDTENLISY
jgi:hypothetical protein